MNKKTSDEKKNRPSYFDRIRKECEDLAPDEPRILENPSLVNFFKFFARKINTLLYVNLLYVLGCFPVFFALFAMTGYVSRTSFAPYYQQYAPLLGVSYFEESPVISSLLGIFGIHVKITVPTVTTYIFFALTLLLFFTFGPANVGTTHLLRSMVREDGIFLWHDYWHAIKRNLKQAVLFGIIDLLAICLLVYDFIYFYVNLGNGTLSYILFFMIFAMGIIYFMMRMYIYLMMITFDLSIFKLLKNALLFSVLGIKRNIMAILGVILISAINYTLFAVFIPLGIILPFILLFSVGGFICTYAAYPKIKQIMIDPYYDENGKPKKQTKQETAE